MLPLHNMAPCMCWVRHGSVERWERNRDAVTIRRGERVAQVIIQRHETVRCVAVDRLSETERGDNGFGSSGR